MCEDSVTLWRSLTCEVLPAKETGPNYHFATKSLLKIEGLRRHARCGIVVMALPPNFRGRGSHPQAPQFRY